MLNSTPRHGDRSWHPRMARAYPDKRAESYGRQDDRDIGALAACVDVLERDLRELERAFDAMHEYLATLLVGSEA